MTVFVVDDDQIPRNVITGAMSDHAIAFDNDTSCLFYTHQDIYGWLTTAQLPCTVLVFSDTNKDTPMNIKLFNIHFDDVESASLFRMAHGF